MGFSNISAIQTSSLDIGTFISTLVVVLIEGLTDCLFEAHPVKHHIRIGMRGSGTTFCIIIMPDQIIQVNVMPNHNLRYEFYQSFYLLFWIDLVRFRRG